MAQDLGERRLPSGLFGLAGAALLLILSMAAPAPAEARWFKAESPSFIVYGSGSERDVRAYARKLEDFEDILRVSHGLNPDEAPPRKLEVYLVSGLSQLRRAWPEAGENVGGFYRAGAENVLAVARRDLGDDHTLFHEYTHHFMYQHFPHAYPAWVAEGYAEYFGWTRIDSKHIDIGLPDERHLAAVRFLGLMDMSDLLTKKPSDLSGMNVANFYAESWLLTHYMLTNPVRKAQMDAYLRAVGSGADPAAAMAKATGADLPTLTKRLRAYEKFTFTRVQRRAAPEDEIKVTALSAAADDLLLENARAHDSIPEKERQGFLARIRTLAARHPDDRLASLTLARAEISFGDRAAAETLLDARLAADPDDAEALYLAGLSRLVAGDAEPEKRDELYRQARPFLVKAHKQDPAHYQTLYAYARSRSIDPGHPSDNTLIALLTARARAPQVAEIAFHAADALIRRGRTAEAVAILNPLAHSPHGKEGAAAARALLARAKSAPAGENGAPTP